jgi:hypothetical protein
MPEAVDLQIVARCKCHSYIIANDHSALDSIPYEMFFEDQFAQMM